MAGGDMEGLDRDPGVCSALWGREKAGQTEDSRACVGPRHRARSWQAARGPGRHGSRLSNSALRPEARHRP